MFAHHHRNLWLESLLCKVAQTQYLWDGEQSKPSHVTEYMCHAVDSATKQITGARFREGAPAAVNCKAVIYRDHMDNCTDRYGYATYFSVRNPNLLDLPGETYTKMLQSERLSILGYMSFQFSYSFHRLREYAGFSQKELIIKEVSNAFFGLFCEDEANLCGGEL